MSAHDTFPDSSLEAMLLRRADRTQPTGLATDVYAALDAVTVPVRGPIPGWREPSPRLAPSRRATWILLAAGLLLALSAAALGAGLWRDDPIPVPRAATGIETLNAEGSYSEVLVDGLGAYWAVGGGTLTRFEPGGDRRTWTIADDLRFGGVAGDRSVAAAGDGGVWIQWQDRVYRFDAERFRESIPAPPDWHVGELAEAPDGTVWAASDRGVRWWDGSSWQATPAGRPTAGARSLVITADGDVWVINQQDWSATGARGVSRLRDDAWTTYTVADAPPLDDEMQSIASAPGGAVLAASSNTIARFDGGRWTPLPAPPLYSIDEISGGGDGSIWAHGYHAVEGSWVARLRDGAWTVYGPDQGFAGARGPVQASADGVFVGTDRGLYRMDGERWGPAWPGVSVPTVVTLSPALVPIRADEAWAADERGAWHYRNGTWEGPLAPSSPGVRAPVAVAPDRSVWLSTAGGVAVLRDGQWQIPWRVNARALAAGTDGWIWASTDDGLERFDARTGERTVVAGCRSPYWLEAAADGTLYVGTFGWDPGGLYAVRGTRCEQLDPLGDGRAYYVLGLDSAPDGSLLAVLADVPPEGSPWTSHIVRRDGGTWSVLETRTSTDQAWMGALGSVALAPDGSAWWARGEGGIVRWDGGRWEMVIADVRVSGSFAFGPDGSLWFVGPSGIQRIRADDLPGQ